MFALKIFALYEMLIVPLIVSHIELGSYSGWRSAEGLEVMAVLNNTSPIMFKILFRSLEHGSTE